MPRRKKRSPKLRIVESHWYAWGLGLFVGIPAIITLTLTDPSPFGFGAGIFTCAACVGSGYVLRAISRRLN